MVRVAAVADGLDFDGESVPLGRAGSADVTLVEGSAFAISDSLGNMTPGSPQGLFFRDSRFLSRLELRLNGSYAEPLAGTAAMPARAA